MKKIILEWLFNKYSYEFEMLMVNSLIGEIPESTKEPTIEFLQDNRKQLEKWLLHQNYVLQKRAVSNPKDAAVISGMLVYIRILMSIISRERPEKNRKDTSITEEKNPVDGVKSFLKGFESVSQGEK